MSTINAQTIIDALRQAHAIAPDEGTELRIYWVQQLRITYHPIGGKHHAYHRWNFLE